MTSNDKMILLQEFINHHMADSHEWTLPFLPVIHLPGFLSYHAIMLLLAVFLMFLVFGVLYRKNQIAPSGLTNLLEAIIVYIRDEISIANLGREDGRRMAPLFCNFFFFILFMNLIGLVPCFAAATSNINVTGALAVVTFMFMTLGAIYLKGFKKFFFAFIPSGVPWPVLLFLTPIEVLSMLVRCCALMIRLFANMLAGHVVIFSFLGLILVFGYVFSPVVLIVVLVYFFELFVAFLQAYIFTLLSAVFIGLIYHPTH